MKSILAVVLIALSATAATAADPVYVIRPTISSKVLPQNAFGATTPTNPVTPPTQPPAPTAPVVFTSIGFDAGLPLVEWSGTVGIMNEAPMHHGYRDGYNFCEIIDDSGKTLASKMDAGVYMGTVTNTPAVYYTASIKGVFRLVMSCGTTSGNMVPVEKFQLTIE